MMGPSSKELTVMPITFQIAASLPAACWILLFFVGVAPAQTKEGEVAVDEKMQLNKALVDAAKE
jgi:hypothetical protein